MNNSEIFGILIHSKILHE